MKHKEKIFFDRCTMVNEKEKKVWGVEPEAVLFNRTYETTMNGSKSVIQNLIFYHWIIQQLTPKSKYGKTETKTFQPKKWILNKTRFTQPTITGSKGYRKVETETSINMVLENRWLEMEFKWKPLFYKKKKRKKREQHATKNSGFPEKIRKIWESPELRDSGSTNDGPDLGLDLWVTIPTRIPITGLGPRSHPDSPPVGIRRRNPVPLGRVPELRFPDTTLPGRLARLNGFSSTAYIVDSESFFRIITADG